MLIRLKYHKSVYEDAEDSWLLQKELEKYIAKHKLKTVLDIGTGTGILAITAAKLGCSVTAMDIDLRACKLAQSNAELNKINIKVICSDLLSSISEKFDLIVFNPPYLPEDEVKTEQDKAIVGGPTGIEVFCRFLEQVKQLTSNVLFVYSSLEDVETMKKSITEAGFKMSNIEEQRFDNERLCIGLLYK